MPEPIRAVPIRVRINGMWLEAEVEPRTLLVDWIREEAELTGTHVGCDTSYCGACTVLVNGRSTKSCTLFACQADGADILTVEGLGSGSELHPLQQAFAEHHGLQCGYCTPGMLMSVSELLARGGRVTEEAIRKAIAGNCCRCTGYQNIFKAVEAAAEKLRPGGKELADGNVVLGGV